MTTSTLADLRRKLTTLETTLQNVADRLVEEIAEPWPEIEYAAKTCDLGIWLLERAISEMRGQP
jgi:hypothetical protein